MTVPIARSRIGMRFSDWAAFVHPWGREAEGHDQLRASDPTGTGMPVGNNRIYNPGPTASSARATSAGGKR